MCTNGTQVPWEVPSLPNPTTRKGWPHHRGRVLLHPTRTNQGRSCETRHTVFRPYPRRLESLTICRCHYKGSTFLSVIFKDPEYWSGRGLNARPPARQTGALPTQPTRWRCIWAYMPVFIILCRAKLIRPCQKRKISYLSSYNNVEFEKQTLFKLKKPLSSVLTEAIFVR